MISSVSVIVLSTAVFMALVVNLAAKPKVTSRLTGIFMTVSTLGGLLIYGIGYTEVLGLTPLAVVRATFSTIGLFLGKNDLSAIAGTFPVSNVWGQTLFWTIHLLGFYTITSAAMMTIGAKALRQLRMLLSFRGDLTVIYGITDETIALGSEIAAQKHCSVILAAEKADENTVASLNNLGMSVYASPNILRGGDEFLKSIHFKNGRSLRVYALAADKNNDYFFCRNLMGALERRGIDAINTRVTLPGTEDILTDLLQHSEEHYGYGFVKVFSEADLAARLMTEKVPIWDTIHFDEDGRACEKVDVVVIGFGHFGQAVLKSLVMNGQYAGSDFHAMVFANDYEKQAGYLETDNKAMFSNYIVEHSTEDARSSRFYSYIEEHLKTLKYIAVCTGREDMNREISDHLMLFLQRRHAENICVVQCGHGGVSYQSAIGENVHHWKLLTAATLDSEVVDRRAIALNAQYDTSERSDWEKWIGCDSFSKMSSRASVDFIPAMLRAVGKSEEDVRENGWELSEQQLQIMGETEHKRWCAFHYCMGYRPMTEVEFDANAALFTAAKERGETPKIRISKNQQLRTHACLVPWEELDDLSDRENEVTGRGVDYKQLDINSVLVVPRLLREVGHR